MDGSGDTVRVLFVVFLTTVFEGDLVHKGSGDGVSNGFIAVVLRFEHQKLPDIIEAVELSAVEVGKAEGLSEQGGD